MRIRKTGLVQRIKKILPINRARKPKREDKPRQPPKKQEENRKGKQIDYYA